MRFAGCSAWTAVFSAWTGLIINAPSASHEASGGGAAYPR